jgi:hypothetical protein
MNGIPAATIDILDASIPDEFDIWQGKTDIERWPHYKEPFMTDPVLWKRHEPPDWAFNLTWHEFRYADVKTTHDINSIIKTTLPGIYIFYIRPERRFLHFPQYALYVGISNENDSRRPLRDRLKDYLPVRVERKKKRLNIDRLLRLYYGVTHRPRAAC